MALDLDAEIRDCFDRGYNTKETTAALGINHGFWVSLRTTQRRFKRLGFLAKGEESPLPAVVDAIEKELAETCRTLGVGQIYRRLLRVHRLHVKRQTVREIVRIIQPGRQEAMTKGRLRRRKYCVRGPNHIWHVDGNDKLKKYGLCVNGAIDGWSRKLMWLHCARTNSKPELICTYYLNAVEDHGIVPLAVRMDRGKENTSIADVQALLRSEHDDDMVNHTVMFGSSNHNQRIERWWGYLRIAVLPTYQDYFEDLIVTGILDTSLAVHIECVRFCFTQNLERELQDHLVNWNRYHRVRKMANVDCPSGLPDYLYSCPEFYGKTDQSKLVDPTMVEDLKVLHNYPLTEFGCVEDFAEWALEVMIENDWALPTSFNEACQLFENLLLGIHALP